MTDDKQYWSDAWYHAQRNMPRFRLTGAGSPRVLRLLLGYIANSSSSVHVDSCIMRGTKPKDPKKQALLQALAGPHGKTIAKATAIQQGIDLSKWKYW